MLYYQENSDCRERQKSAVENRYSFIEQAEIGIHLPFVFFIKDKKITLPNTDQ